MNIQLKSTGVITIALVLSAALIIIATVAISPGEAQQMNQEEMMTMMGPMMTQMMDSMMETMLTKLAKPETAEKLATFSKNYYDALLTKGFSKEDALEIVTSMGIPSVPSMK